ncbi:hypothetical protein BJ170DRAFT_180176 [Xylariales sp. AK1849]|nr:hypothetical protein BJ170DRAFT_180176 [Xylariales sp. AK1849]
MRSPLAIPRRQPLYMLTLDTSIASHMMDYESPKYQNGGEFAMQKYLLLQSQHEELRQHMHELCPTYSSCSSSTAVTSPSVSPTRSFTMSPPGKHTSPSPSRNHRRSSMPSTPRHGVRPSPSALEPVLDEELMGEMAADEQRLCDVNEGIKRALTELLNSEAVRKDRAMRTWVQTRLMDTERELRTGRRRRSNGSAD